MMEYDDGREMSLTMAIPVEMVEMVETVEIMVAEIEVEMVLRVHDAMKHDHYDNHYRQRHCFALLWPMMARCVVMTVVGQYPS